MDDKNWDLIIKPQRRLFDLRLGEFWKYRDLVMLFVRRDFVSRYKQTILGPLWLIIQPILTSLVFTVIFGNIAGLPTDGLPQILFYLSGTVLWSYFANCLTGTSMTFITNANIFGKVFFPRLVMPTSIIISNLITLAIQFVMFLAFLVYFYARGTNINLSMWAYTLPLLIILMAGLSFGFGIIVSSLTTKYRDLTHLITFGVTLWMYLTPVIYPVSSIPGKLRWIAQINPVSPIIETFRAGFLGAGNASWMGLAYSAIFMLIVIIIGVVIFNRVEKNFIDTV